MAVAVFCVFVMSTALLPLTQSTPPTIATPRHPPGCPRECSCLDGNQVVDCSNRGLFRLPTLPTNVVKLDLSGNLLKPMINGSFEHLRELREIDLSQNGLMRVLLCTFSRLLELRKVDLHGNRLRSLPEGLFGDNDKMQELDLSHNDLDTLPNLLLHRMPLLKVLNVSHNQATTLKLGMRFQLLTQLTVLDLSHNPFTNATQEAFQTASTWNHQVPRSLDLSFCQLQHIHPRALRSIPGLRNFSLAGNSLLPFQEVVDVLKEMDNTGLEAVDLSHMNISNPALFSEVHLTALKELDLSSNTIGSVPTATFGNIRSLQKLDISRNYLTSLGDGFEDLVNLLELNISHCRLTSFTGSAVGGLQQLKVLDLSHNQLLDAAQVDLGPLQALTSLDLSSNSLQSAVLPGDCQHLHFLSFASNALTTLPSMNNMRSLRYFSAYDNNLQSLSQFLFTGARDIEVANFSHNDLDYVDHKVFLPVSPKIIDLSHNLLTRTQFFSWSTTEEVHLQNNRLNNLDQQTFYDMSRLTVLDLGHNNLSIINEETFRYLGNVTKLRLSNNSLSMTNFNHLFRAMDMLQDLDLGFNRISAINATSFHPLTSLRSLSLSMNRLKVIPVALFEPLEKLSEVDISGNPFHCACDLLPLRDWLRKTSVKISERYDLNITNMCATPWDKRGQAVTFYKVKQFQCDTKMLYLLIFGTLGGLGIIIGIVFSIGCHYYGKRRKSRRTEPDQSRYERHKEETSSWKENNRNQVDLVHVSKRPDPYSKQELVNGWLTSKQFPVAKKNIDPQHHTDHHQGTPPPRPPWPEQASGGRGKKEDKGRREKSKDRGKEKGERHRSKQDGKDRKIRSVSETVPLKQAHAYTRPDRTATLLPVWEDPYYDKYPIKVDLKHVPDPWTEFDHYPSWGPPQLLKTMYNRDTGRYYTLPYPLPWPRYPPYGPDYPYRRRVAEGEEVLVEQHPRPRPSRALPYPPREVVDHGSPQRQATRDEQQATSYHQQQQHQQQSDYDTYPPNRQREYDQRRRFDTRDEDFRRNGPDDRQTSPELMDTRREQHHYENTHLTGERPAGASNTKGNGPRENGNARSLPNHQAIKHGTSDAQIQRRDSDYRHAMDHPIGPKAASSPLLVEDKASDWL